ncbi:carotenoid cleavage dioxygenase [Duganella sacchari]|uniref:Carotenoid cleavage dioxygenase n=1 Tax=Duganella sacchari TaxID=551987 RepID=A0A1M7MJ55_9BURK|nr:carotenoid oxygenase family protein [Duganella sacchari]SHM90481.1 carotenoid cleavage dioxygenase [Duganella sacchari]
MLRRDFLHGLAASGALLALPARAAVDETRARYLANLSVQPRLAALRGCTAERLSGVATITGRWPAELSGTFYRNGPARFELGGERYHHWFDGDGMVHAWRIEAGRIGHAARFVGTPKYVEESAAGQFLYPAFGTDIARRPVRNNDTLNTANTNVVPHAGRLYALWEGGSATELDAASLASRGPCAWRTDLAAMPFSAHPRITPDGVLWNFGVVPGANKLLLWRIDADGTLGRFGMVKVAHLPMVHDFVVTARYLVFLVPPFDMESDARTYLDAHVWNSKRPLRALVINRADFSLQRVIEMPAGVAFHLGNGWDDGDTVRFDACLTADDSGLRALAGVMRGENWHEAVTDSMLITLNLRNGTARSETLLRGTEFPRVAAAEVGARYRQLFMTTTVNTDQFGMTGVASVDLDSGRVDRFEYGPDWIVEEHIPLPKAGGAGQWLLGVACDMRQQQSVLTVLDGAQLSQGPVAQAHLPYAAPLCFHGNFLAV